MAGAAYLVDKGGLLNAGQPLNFLYHIIFDIDASRLYARKCIFARSSLNFA
jgi:hypothetical protein